MTKELKKKMRRAYDEVAARAEEDGSSLREGAFTVAVGEVSRAMELWGL